MLVNKSYRKHLDLKEPEWALANHNKYATTNSMQKLIFVTSMAANRP